jgi:hypothetical protein
VEVDPEDRSYFHHRSAESLLLFRRNSCPGILCKVVIPCTDGQLAIAEIGRKRSVYAAKTIVNTAAHRLVRRRLLGFLAYTLFQSERRLRLC